MSTVIPNDFAQVAQFFTCNGAPHPFAVVTGHVVDNPAFGANDVAQSVRNGWFTWWDDFTRPTAWALAGTKALYRNAGGTLLVGESTVVNAGTDAGGQTPVPNAAILVKKKTGIAGPKQRGRMFVPPFGLAEANVNMSGVMDAAVVTVIQNAINVMVASWVTNDVTPVLLHSDATPPSLINVWQVDARMATQRRRLRG